jgi:hypothetical protein
MTIVYNVDVTPERNKDEFVVLEAFPCPTTDTVPLLPRGSIIDRDGTS